MGWTVPVLIPKCDTDTRGIGILDTLWKVVEALIHTGLRDSLQFHNVLYGFRAGRGTGTYIMDLKLAQEIANVYHAPLFLVFFNLCKAYNNVGRDRLIQTLEVYVAGTCMCGLLEISGPTNKWL